MVAFALDWISCLSAVKKEYREPVDSGASFAGKSFSYLSLVLYFIDGCWIQKLKARIRIRNKCHGSATMVAICPLRIDARCHFHCEKKSFYWSLVYYQCSDQVTLAWYQFISISNKKKTIF
jgi:hypothetical protein